MSQMKRLTAVTWWIIHLFYVPVSVYGVAAVFVFRREFVEIDGKRHCAEGHRIYTIAFLGSLDFAINSACIVILAGPTILSPITEDVKAVVVRNCVTMGLAGLSTALMYTYAAISSNGERLETGSHFYLIVIMMKLAALDVAVNMLMVSISWPWSFYKKVLDKSSQSFIRIFTPHASRVPTRRQKNNGSSQVKLSVVVLTVQ